jgi:hypothetical protein
LKEISFLLLKNATILSIPYKINNINNISKPSGITWVIEKNLMNEVLILINSYNCQKPPKIVGISIIRLKLSFIFWVLFLKLKCK